MCKKIILHREQMQVWTASQLSPHGHRIEQEIFIVSIVEDSGTVVAFDGVSMVLMSSLEGSLRKNSLRKGVGVLLPTRVFQRTEITDDGHLGSAPWLGWTHRAPTSGIFADLRSLASCEQESPGGVSSFHSALSL